MERPVGRALSPALRRRESCQRSAISCQLEISQIALGSASEVEYQLLLARGLGILEPTAHQRVTRQCTEVKRMLTALIRKLTADR